MDTAARDTYLMTQVMTAAPQKLQLMLIDGAIRFANQVRSHWQSGENEQAFEALVRCRQVVTELIAGVKPDGSDLTRKVRSVYAYLFRTLTEAQWEHNVQKIDNVLSILDVERQTWRQVCEQLGATRPEYRLAAASTHSSDAVAPALPPGAGGPGATSSSLSNPSLSTFASDDPANVPATGISFTA
jgi:flagellar protein FliS